jgi:aerobic carbon-monoxide dehydrogenase medium subunit
MYTMRPGEFTYHRPATVDEAVALLAGDGEARPLAGGHSLLPIMKLRLVEPAALVDIGRIPGLDAIEVGSDGLRIGAMATHAAVAGSAAVLATCPVLAETAAQIGDHQVRNRGTIGGSVAHADPGADYPTVLTALGATMLVAGPGGERETAADDFFRGVFSTALGAGELVTAVRVPATQSGTGAAYSKKKHPASGYAVAGAAAVVTLANGSCTAARLVLGGVTGAPARATAAETLLIGSSASAETIAAAAQAAAESLVGEPLGDSYASGEYRVHLATVLAGRALAAAIERA